MLDVAQEYTKLYGSREYAYLAFARGLASGDRASLKAGYSPENAAIATVEAFGLDDDETATLCADLGADSTVVGACVRSGGGS